MRPLLLCEIRTEWTDLSDEKVTNRRIESWEQVGRRVAAARLAAGFTQEGLANRLGLHRSAVSRIEQGERQLDVLELVRLASALGRSADWFLSEPPVHVASHRRESSDSREVQRLEDELEAAARDVELLVDIGELAEPDVSRLGYEDLEGPEQAQAAADEARALLAVDGGPVWDLPDRVASVGLHAFSVSLGSDVIDGGYVRLNGVGVAVVNGDADPGRRRFSLAHELAHHLLADEYSAEFGVGETREDREGLLNVFAIHLLMPRQDVLARWQELRDDGHDERSAAIVLASEFRVSWSAACNQLRNLGALSGQQRSTLEVRRPTSADYIELGLSYATELDPPQLPAAFARAALRAYRHNKIGRQRALELLRGTLEADELPEADAVPIDGLRSELSGPP